MAGERYLSVEEVADKYGVHADTVRRWLLKGAVQAIRVGPGERPRVRITEDEAKKLVR
jgi:excisionase family DNA binding protein